MPRPKDDGQLADYRRAAMRWLLVSAMTVAPVGLALAAASVDPATVVARIAVTPPAVRPFVEVRRTRLLRKPAVSSGRLELLGHGHLAKEVTRPRPQRLEIDGTVARVSLGGRTREVDLAGAPDVRAVFTALGGVMEGNLDTIGTVFQIRAQEGPDGWLLQLTPTGKEIARRIVGISFVGKDRTLTCVVVAEPNGTSTVTVMAPGQPSPLAGNLDAWLAAHCGLVSPT